MKLSELRNLRYNIDTVFYKAFDGLTEEQRAMMRNAINMIDEQIKKMQEEQMTTKEELANEYSNKSLIDSAMEEIDSAIKPDYLALESAIRFNLKCGFIAGYDSRDEQIKQLKEQLANLTPLPYVKDTIKTLEVRNEEIKRLKSMIFELQNACIDLREENQKLKDRLDNQ